MAVVGAHLLAGHFGHGVGADGLQNGVLFGKGHFFVHAINGRAAGEDKLTGAVAAGVFQQVEGAFDVDVDVEFRCLNGGADTGARGQVDDGIGLKVGDGGGDEGRVGQLAFIHGHAVLKAADVGAFDGGVVVGVEAVENGDAIRAIAQQALHGVRADESGTASDENFHDEKKRGDREVVDGGRARKVGALAKECNEDLPPRDISKMRRSAPDKVGMP